MTGPTYTIRPRTNSDLPACADAMRAVHAIDGYPVGGGIEDPHGFLLTDDKAWVAGVRRWRRHGGRSRPRSAIQSQRA